MTSRGLEPPASFRSTRPIDPGSATASRVRVAKVGVCRPMVTFNTGQRRMSLPLQLEIMQSPLIHELRDRAGIRIWREIEKTSGKSKPKDEFAASDLFLATQAFITANVQVTASDEPERFLDQDQAYLDNVGDISDVVTVLKRVGKDIHDEVMRVYAQDPIGVPHLAKGWPRVVVLAAARNRALFDQASPERAGPREPFPPLRRGGPGGGGRG